MISTSNLMHRLLQTARRKSSVDTPFATMEEGTMPQPTETSAITEYHAHVYYDAVSRDRAAALRAWVADRFTVRMGRWHDVPVGPHPCAMYQIAFAPDQFPALVPFLMLNRQGLTVLVHPESGRPRDDHTLHAAWMGEVLPLKTNVLRETDTA